MAQERKNANQEVLAQTDVVDNNDNRTSFDMASSTPAELTYHTVSKTYIIAGITPGQFLGYDGSFNFSDLQSRFSTICKDYMQPLDLNSESRAVAFCDLVIYKIVPDWRRGKRTDNKIYRLKFPYVTEESKLITTTCFISDYRGVEYKENYKAGSSISLNITLAEMLAVCVLNQLVSIGIKLNVMLLTPLAAACFKKDDIKELAKATNSSTEQVLKDINSGCQSGGQYLPNGYLHVALCSVIVCTKGLTNNKMRESIIGKTIKQYYQCKKPLDDALFTTYCSFASGGIPGSLNVRNLIAQSEKAEPLPSKQLAKACAQTMLTTTVQVLQPSSGGATASAPFSPQN